MLTIKKTALAAAITATFLYGCHSSDSSTSGGVTAPEASTPLTNPITVLINDETGNPASGTVTGKVYVDAGGAEVSSATSANAAGDELPFSTDNGLLNLNPTEYPVKLRVVAEPNATFRGGSVSIMLDAAPADGETSAETYSLAVAKKQPEENVAIVRATKTATLTGGETGEAIMLASGSGSEKNAAELAGGGAELSIPAGTSFKDASGNVIEGDSLSIDMSYYSNDPDGEGSVDGSSLASFPGGFAVEVAAEEGDEATQGDFVSAGFAAVEMKVGDTVVKEFSQPVDITFKVPKGTKHPETGQVVNAGDTIPVWSYDETTGKWTRGEGNLTATLAEASPASDKYLIATAAVTHLSYWNLDWFGSDRCESKVNFTIEGNTAPLKFELRRTGGGWSRTGQLTGNDLDSLTLNNAPSFGGYFVLFDRGVKSSDGEPTYLITSSTVGTVSEGVLEVDSYCDLDGATLTIDSDKLPTYINQSAILTEYCEEDETKSRTQPAYLTIYQDGRYIDWAYSSASDKPAKLKGLADGGVYQIYYSYRSKLLGRWNYNSYQYPVNVTAAADEVMEIKVPVDCAGDGMKPTAAPTPLPTRAPTATPSTSPTATPSTAPTATPSTSPTATPSTSPTATPSTAPTATPSTSPTATPSSSPTATPSTAPTATPSTSPTATPTPAPTGTGGTGGSGSGGGTGS